MIFDIRPVFEAGTTANAHPVAIAFTVCGHPVCVVTIEQFVSLWEKVSGHQTTEEAQRLQDSIEADRRGERGIPAAEAFREVRRRIREKPRG